MPQPASPDPADLGQTLRAQQRVLRNLRDALGPLADPVAIQHAALQVLGEHLGSDRAYYVEVDRARRASTIGCEWHRSGVPGHGRHLPWEPWSMPELADGMPWVVRNVDTDPALPEAQRASYRTHGIGACLAVPLVKGGHVIAALVIEDRAPRAWTGHDVALVVDTAERTWAALQQARAEAALHQSDSRLRALIEHLPGGAVFVVDHELRYELAQGEALATAGFMPDDLVGRTVAQALPPELVPEYETHYRDVLAGASFTYEHTAHGRTYVTRGVPLSTAAGTISAALAVSYDITERTRAEAMMQNLNQILEQRIEQRTRELADKSAALQAVNEELEAFHYSISHDLMTPVRHVEGFTSMALRTLQEPDKARRSLTIVLQAARRMEALINAMRLLSRTGQHEMTMGLVDLGALTHQARLDALPQANGRPIDWRIGRLPLVQGDRVTLQQVMTYLLDNAVKYSQGQEGAAIEVWAEEDARQWTVFVRDNGVGFDPAYAGKLFGIFQRLHPQDEFAGVGVGLAVVRRIITRHGGTVGATGAVGQGATVHFTVPKPPPGG